jgi:ribosomal protein L32
MRQRTSLCQQGRHIPARALARIDSAQGNTSLPHRHCSRCGHLLVKSPITQRWRPTGLMG